jgi:hypothetical protein
MGTAALGRRRGRPEGLTGKRGAAPAAASGDVIHDGFDLVVVKTLDGLGRGSFIARNGRCEVAGTNLIKIACSSGSWVHRNQTHKGGGEAESNEDPVR